MEVVEVHFAASKQNQRARKGRKNFSTAAAAAVELKRVH
jgi:hypothetical protein